MTLAAIIGCSVLADRLGAFRLAARLLVPDRAPRTAAAAAVLAFTALLSALVNLDVAVVVATPVAMRAAHHHRPPAGRLAVAVAVTANATSFLLPTSNVTSLLLARAAVLPPSLPPAPQSSRPSATCRPPRPCTRPEPSGCGQPS